MQIQSCCHLYSLQHCHASKRIQHMLRGTLHSNDLVVYISTNTGSYIENKR